MRKHWKLIAYLLGFLVLTVTLALTQPLSDPDQLTAPPDENSRYLIPTYIYEHGTLPTGLEEEVRISGYGFSYALYNAFPYIVMGLAMRAVGLINADPAVLLMTARFVNVMAGFLMAWVVYLLAKRIFQEGKSQWLFCLAITYQPMNLFIHSYVNTDSFCMLSTALIAYGLVRLYQEKADLRSCLWIAGGVTLCALSYYNAYGYILATVILFAARFMKDGKAIQREDGLKAFMKYGALTAVLVLAGAGWWFIRQGIVLNGDFLGLRTRAAMTAVYGAPEIQQANSFSGQGYSYIGMIGEMFRRQLPAKMAATLIAAYGAMTVRPQTWFYILYTLVWGAGLIGCVIRIPSLIREKQKTGWKRKLFHACMLMCVILPLILFLQYCYTTDYQEQGRYLLPALIPAMYYVTKGLDRFGEKACCCASAVIVFCAAWQVFAVALPAYLSNNPL